MTLGVPVEARRDHAVVDDVLAVVEGVVELLEVEGEADRATQVLRAFAVAAEHFGRRLVAVEAAEDEVEQRDGEVGVAFVRVLLGQSLRALVHRVLEVLRGDLRVVEHAGAEVEPHGLVLHVAVDADAVGERQQLAGVTVQAARDVRRVALVLGVARVAVLVVVGVPDEVHAERGLPLLEQEGSRPDRVPREAPAVVLDGLARHDRQLEHRELVLEARDGLGQLDLEGVFPRDAHAGHVAGVEVEARVEVVVARRVVQELAELRFPVAVALVGGDGVVLLQSVVPLFRAQVRRVDEQRVDSRAPVVGPLGRRHRVERGERLVPGLRALALVHVTPQVAIVPPVVEARDRVLDQPPVLGVDRRVGDALPRVDHVRRDQLAPLALGVRFGDEALVVVEVHVVAQAERPGQAVLGARGHLGQQQRLELQRSLQVAVLQQGLVQQRGRLVVVGRRAPDGVERAGSGRADRHVDDDLVAGLGAGDAGPARGEAQGQREREQQRAPAGGGAGHAEILPAHHRAVKRSRAPSGGAAARLQGPSGA